MEVTMLLCDAAQEIGGKLYILGGGWSVVFQNQPNATIRMALASVVSVPWNQTNERHRLAIALLTEDGDEVDLGEGPVRIDAGFEVGRPPGLKPGTNIDGPFVANFDLALSPGGYVWEVSIDGTPMTRRPFRVMSAAQGG